MKKYLVIVCILASVFGCSTTPKSIKQVSALEMQYLEALKKDFETTVDAYDKERTHWTNLAYQQAVNSTEAALTLINEDGTKVIDTTKYKQALTSIVTQRARVDVEYEKNKRDILAAFKYKIGRAKQLQLLINEYKNSTGVDPETLRTLIIEIGEAHNAITQVTESDSELISQAEADNITSDWSVLYDTILNNAYTRVYNAVLNPPQEE